MTKDIKEWINVCPTCQAHARVQRYKMGKMTSILIYNPFEVVSMDIITGLPVSNKDNRAIVVFSDYFTKWAKAVAIPDETALTVAKKLIKGVLCRHGAPRKLISDRGTQFTSDIFREATDLLGMKQSMTSGYYPQADGQAERNINTLSKIMAKLSDLNPQDWDI